MSSPGSQAPGSTSRPESPSDPDPGHGGQQRREQPQTAERLPAAGALVLEAILLKRQQLYQTVLKALEGRGSADEHYTRVLMGIQELLEAEDVASVAEEVSSRSDPQRGCLDEEQTQKLSTEREVKLLAGQLSGAQKMAEAAVEECNRWRSEAEEAQHVVLATRMDVQERDTTIQQLQQKVSKYRSEAHAQKKGSEVLQKQLSVLQLDRQDVKRCNEERLRSLQEELQACKDESAECKAKFKAYANHHATVASSAEAATAEATAEICKLRKEMAALRKNEHKAREESEAKGLEAARWRHAAEYAADVAEKSQQRIVEMEEQHAEAKRQGEAWRIKAEAQQGELDKLRADWMSVQDRDARSMAKLSWMESAVTGPILDWCAEYGSGPPAESAGLALETSKKSCQRNDQGLQLQPGLVSSALRAVLDAASAQRTEAQYRNHEHERELKSVREQCDQQLEDVVCRFKAQQSEIASRQRESATRSQKWREQAGTLAAEVVVLKTELAAFTEDAKRHLQEGCEALCDLATSALQGVEQRHIQEVDALQRGTEEGMERERALRSRAEELLRRSNQLDSELVKSVKSKQMLAEEVAHLGNRLSCVDQRWRAEKERFMYQLLEKEKDMATLKGQLDDSERALLQLRRQSQSVDAHAAQKQEHILNLEKEVRRLSEAADTSGVALEKATEKNRCLEDLACHNEGIVRRQEEQIEELNRALDARKANAIASEAAAREARHSAAIAAAAVEANALALKELKQKLRELEVAHEDKLECVRAQGRRELQACQAEMRKELATAQSALEILRAKQVRVRQWVGTVETLETLPLGDTGDYPVGGFPDTLSEVWSSQGRAVAQGPGACGLL